MFVNQNTSVKTGQHGIQYVGDCPVNNVPSALSNIYCVGREVTHDRGIFEQRQSNKCMPLQKDNIFVGLGHLLYI